MGGVKKGVKNFRKGQAKAAKQGLNPANSFNKGARSKPRQEVKLDEVEIEEKLLKVKRKDKEAVASTGTMKGHKEEMGNLEEMDPEFFDFLKKNDQSLLDFGDGESEDDEGEDGEDSDEDEDGLDDMEDDADSEDEEEEVKARKPRKERQAVEVTEKLLKETVSKAKKGNLQALKKTLAIFRSACVPNGGEDVDDVDEEEGETVSKFIIGSAHVYELVMYSVLDSAFVAFYSILDLPAQGKPTKEQLASLGGHERWKRTQLLVLSFFKSYMQVLGGLAKGAGNKPLIDGDEKDESAANVLVYLLQAIEPYIPLLAAMPRLGKALLKVFLYIWAEGPDPANDSKSRRARAFLRIRQMAVQLPGSYTEECFRCLYLSYTRCCKTFTEYTGASVLFMSRCIVELYQTDLQQAYQQSFLYIRQLALHLRSAVMKKSSESIRQITSWQFLNCLRLWTRVVIAMPKEDELGALAFPLSQVMSGVMASAQSIYSLPARFHIIQCLQLIAAHCQCFVPTVHKMLEVLEHPDIVTGKPSSSTDVAPKLQFSVKLPNDSVSRAPVRDLLVNEALVLIRHDAEIYRHHVGFPEYTYITVRKLKAFAKGAKVAKWRGKYHNLNLHLICVL